MNMLTISTFEHFKTGQVSESVEIPVDVLFDKLTDTPTVNTGAKEDGECFTPGYYDNETGTMVAADLRGICAVVLDFDGEGHGPLTDSQRSELICAIEGLGYDFAWYETWNLGLRVVMPTATEISAPEHEQLYDSVSAALPRQADPKCRNASRKNALPQVPSAGRAATHRADYVIFGRQIVPGALVGAVPRGAPSASAGTGFRPVAARNAADLELFLSHAVDGEKNDVLFRQTFSAAACMFREGASREQVLDQLQKAAERGLQKAVAKGATVRSWIDVSNTVTRKVTAAFDEVERERQEAVAQIPKGVLKTAEKLIRDKNIPALGKLLGPRVSPSLSAEALAAEAARMIEADPKCNYSSVPDAQEQIKEAIIKNKLKDWAAQLRINQDGTIDASEENLVSVFEHHPECQDLFERNLRSVVTDRLRKDAPWGQRKGEQVGEASTAMFGWVRDELKLQKPRFAVLDAVVDRFVKASPEIDPFLNYVRSVQGDPTKDTLSTLLIEQFGVEDTAFARAVTRKTLIAACARADQPGCWLDSILILYSPTGGHGKTKFWQMLVPDRELAGTIKDLSERETPIKLQRYVFSIVDEIDKWSGKKASGELKEFLSEEQANTRAAYARKETNYKRRGVIVGNTNIAKFTHDPSGARRYWVLETTAYSPLVERNRDLAYVQSVRDQVWFEAWRAYQAGESWHMSRQEREALGSASEHVEVLKRREPTAESEALLEFMANVSDIWCSANSRASDRDGKVAIFKDQMIHGHYLQWISEKQIKELMTIKGWHGVNIKHVIESAGLERRGGRMSTGWQLPAERRLEHEAWARDEIASSEADSSAQAALMRARAARPQA